MPESRKDTSLLFNFLRLMENISKRLLDEKHLKTIQFSFELLENIQTEAKLQYLVEDLLDQLTLLVLQFKNDTSPNDQIVEDNHKFTKDCKQRNKKIHKCNKCRKQFASDELLTSHVKVLHGKPEDKIEDVSAVDDTVKETSDLPIYCCQSCYSCSKNNQDFINHLCDQDNATNKTPYKDLALLEQHNKFACNYCHEEFRIFHRIKIHLGKCRGGPMACEVCGLEFQSRKVLNDHKVEKHPDDLPFRCHECPKMFKLNTSLQKHLVNRHEKKVTSFECEKCSKRFVKKLYLTNHQTRFHNIFKPFLCQFCGERFISSNSLSSHLQIHQNIKPHICPDCGKMFRRKDKLEFHLATHSGLKPHSCSLCHKAFARKSKLKDHLRRHTGEKRFSCLVCNKMYSGSYDLRQHLIRHHPNISRTIKPNVPLTPQIINNIVRSPSKNVL